MKLSKRSSAVGTHDGIGSKNGFLDYNEKILSFKFFFF
jgi:hypothetical protein